MYGYHIFVRHEDGGPLHFIKEHVGRAFDIDAFDDAYVTAQEYPGKSVLVHSQGKQVLVPATDGMVPLAIRFQDNAVDWSFVTA